MWLLWRTIREGDEKQHFSHCKSCLLFILRGCNGALQPWCQGHSCFQGSTGLCPSCWLVLWSIFSLLGGGSWALCNRSCPWLVSSAPRVESCALWGLALGETEGMAFSKSWLQEDETAIVCGSFLILGSRFWKLKVGRSHLFSLLSSPQQYRFALSVVPKGRFFPSHPFPYFLWIQRMRECLSATPREHWWDADDCSSSFVQVTQTRRFFN